MASSCNSRFIPLAAGLGMMGVFANSGEPAKAAPPDKAAAPQATGQPAAPVAPAKDRLDLPVPKGQPQKGLRIPIFSPDGKPVMNFQIGVAEVVDADNIKLGQLRLETFKENGEHEFDIDLPDSVFNAKTKELTSKGHVMIKRHDFEISGNSMTFNTETRSGTFGNGVKMVIYDARAAAGEDDEKPEVPAIEVKPVQEEKK
ncbi:MAG: hypothetical protein ABIP20_00250 [Chthoniobacteraceae bacterium]